MQESPLRERLGELERRSAAADQPVTVRRPVAFEVLVRRDDQPSADAVYEEVAAELAGVSKSTVYRALEHLVRLGLARRVDHDASVARYDANLERHHHLLCLRCRSVSDVSSESLDAIPPPVPRHDFLIRDFSVSFRGLCRDCALGEPGDQPAGETR